MISDRPAGTGVIIVTLLLAALLEVMQERQITIEGESFPLGAPFVVLATQNPLDQEGTYPLPEAELDRFLFKILIDYPDQEHEARMVDMVLDGRLPDSLDAAQRTPSLIHI